MTALARLLFPAPAIRRAPLQLLGWWESRRPSYNLIVGAAGLVTLALVSVIGMLPPPLNTWFPWPLIVIAYGVCANVCYTFGFAIEALLERMWGDEVSPVGPTLFRHGLVFSVGLTLLPIAMASLGYVANLAVHLIMR